MIYLLILAAICAVACLLFIASLILKDTEKDTPPSLPADPYVFKHVESLKNKPVNIPKIDIEEDNLLDLTGLSARAKKAIALTGAFTIIDLEIGTFSFYLHNTKGIGPKTIAEINAWSVANYDIKITK